MSLFQIFRLQNRISLHVFSKNLLQLFSTILERFVDQNISGASVKSGGPSNIFFSNFKQK